MDIRNALILTAKHYRTSPEKMKAEMQKAITEAWMKPDETESERKLQAEVPCRGAIPTPEEFLLYCNRKLCDYEGTVP